MRIFGRLPLALLEVKNITKRFGGLTVLNDVSFEVNEGEIVGLIGPNGAGKTTMFNVISGTLPATAGKVFVKGEDITNIPSHGAAKKGIVRTFQTPTVWGMKIMIDNVRMGMHIRAKVGFWESFFNMPSKFEHEKWEVDEAMRLLRFMGLGEMAYQRGRAQSYGRRRGLGIAVALSSEPMLVMLDEPVTGMMASEERRMMDRIRKIRDELGVTVLVVEHHMKFVMGVCERIVALNFGQKIAEGTPEYITSHPAVIEAYLGVD